MSQTLEYTHPVGNKDRPGKIIPTITLLLKRFIFPAPICTVEGETSPNVCHGGVDLQ